MALARAAGEAILPLFRADIDDENKAKPGERYDPRHRRRDRESENRHPQADRSTRCYPDHAASWAKSSGPTGPTRSSSW